MIFANFNDTKYVVVYDVWQYDYGQILRIQGLNLPPAVEIHFSLQETAGEAMTRVGVTKDNVTDVTIPDSMLENNDTTTNYNMYAFVYVTDETSGQTEYKIKMVITARPRPEVFDTPEDKALFEEAIKAVNESAERAESAEQKAEGWAHGREDMPEREEDNAKYYSEQAEKVAMEIPGQVEDAKAEIDEYVQGKEEELKGETGDVYFAAFKVVDGRLVMYSDPEIDKVRFVRIGSRLYYRLNF